MEQKTNLRHLHILQYLYEKTDDEHPASTADITEYLAEKGIAVHRQTIASDVELLINFGFDIITVRSRQNQYFYGSRQFELAELKMMVDAIQAARFVTNKKSEVLTNKLMQLTSSHHASKLNRQLFVTGRVKATNESVLYTVDLLYEAINENKRIQFKYYEYTSDKKKILKHKGYLYEFSPAIGRAAPTKIAAIILGKRKFNTTVSAAFAQVGSKMSPKMLFINIFITSSGEAPEKRPTIKEAIKATNKATNNPKSNGNKGILF